MQSSRSIRLFVILCLLLLALAVLPATALAQGVPAGDTPTPEAPTFTPTATMVPTETPVPTDTPAAQPATATATVVATATPVPPKTVPIPEPFTILLFGTGLAALSTAVAARRRR